MLRSNKDELEDGKSGQAQATNDPRSSMIQDSRLLRHNSQDSSSSDFAMNLGKESNPNQVQNESGPGSFSSTSTISSGEASNTNKVDGDDEGVVEGNSNSIATNNVNIEPEPSKFHRMQQV